MKKSLLFFCLLPAALWLAGCSQNGPDEEVSGNRSIGNEHALGKEEAIAEALEAVRSLAPAAKSGGRTVGEVRTVCSAGHTRSGLSGEPLYHVVNFADRAGFAVIAADRRQPATVYACSETGNLPADAAEDGTLGMVMDRIGTLAASSVGAGIAPRIRPGENVHAWRTIARIPRLVGVRWGQNYPYGENQRAKRPDETQQEYEAAFWKMGHPWAAAFGQLMSYHAWPARYDWTEINKHISVLGSQTESYTKAFGKIYDMFLDIIPVIHNTYMVDSLYHFGYVSDPIAPYRYENVKASIDSRRPVFMCGMSVEGNKGGLNAWLIDGYLVRERYHEYFTPIAPPYFHGGDAFGWTESQTLVHCNLGRNGTGNGYYLSDLFDFSTSPVLIDPDVMDDPTGLVFDPSSPLTVLRMVTNIRPQPEQAFSDTLTRLPVKNR